MSAARLIARKEAGELLLSLRGLSWLMAVAVALSVFGLLLVSNTELSLLDNAQVVYDMVAIVTALGGLLALVVGLDAVAGERERGSLVALLLTPASRDAILSGKLGGIAVAWAVMYALALPYLWAVGSTGQNLREAVTILAVLGSPVVLGFGFFGMALGARLATARTALLTGLIGLMISASPLLLGPSLRQSAIGRAFDVINPISAAVNAYDGVIIDSQPVLGQWPHALLAAAWLVLALWLARSGFRRVAR
ncbi:ABC-2 type transport system permease protein [Enhydrobacter aerosaccus]|uniref:ABC-2 type transport system permease protein n=1 Tax=Enhydrobacter aerosaccus TaxID=225324 RepID=A0A1T4SBP0_9HYPH|nr:ABC transporter permease subunit [Enhydrobacter aerosaccus]SKA25597.1 ABC-2 type transport system permease protein [Enhydrobacter aerosaccus]